MAPNSMESMSFQPSGSLASELEAYSVCSLAVTARVSFPRNGVARYASFYLTVGTIILLGLQDTDIPLVFTIVGVFLQWFSSGTPGDLGMLFGGKVLTGIPLGVFVTIAPTYCAEIAPMALRGAVTSAVNFSIVFGQALAYIVMRQTQYYEDANTYRVLFGVQWVFAAVGLGVLYWFPESPYFLVGQGRMEKAKANARRLYRPDFDVEGFISSIKMTLDREAETQKEASFRECFRGTNTLRTLIATSTMFIQSICGIGWIIG